MAVAPRSAQGLDLELISSMASASRFAHGVGPGFPSPWRVGCIPTSASARSTTPSARASAARIVVHATWSLILELLDLKGEVDDDALVLV
nr:predicted protein [Triticum aestivum]